MDLVNGYGQNSSGRVRARSCWGGYCGSIRSGSKNQKVTTTYKVWYGHKQGGANEQAWSY